MNSPDLAIYPSTTVPLLSVDYRSFCDNQSTGSIIITFRVDRGGLAAFFVDRNGTGAYENGSSDIFFEKSVPTAGRYNLLWNGKDANGTGVELANGSTISLDFKSQNSPIHFPLYDVENNPRGFTIFDVRPGVGGSAEYVYWNDSNLSTFPGTSINLTGLNSATGAHPWTGGVGDQNLVNTWTFGEVNDIVTNFTFNYQCDVDGDGVSDVNDLDKDNDGICDITENGGINVSLDADGDGIPNLFDVDFIHPIYGAFVDEDDDQINDIFDLDQDGIPNHLDHDADGDGMPDAIEANRGKTPAGYIKANGSIGGAVGINGMPNLAETSSESGLSAYPTPNTDEGTRPDFLDYDSDNDGIIDNVEFQPYGLLYRAPVYLDADKDGIDNQYDVDCLPCGLVIGFRIDSVNTDGDLLPDYLDTDSDDDGVADWMENADDNKNGQSIDDLIARGAAYTLACGCTKYPNNVDVDANGTPDWVQSGGDSTSRFMRFNHTLYYFDTDFDGLVDLFDTSNLGQLPTYPDNNGNTVPNWRDQFQAISLPIHLISFNAQISYPGVEIRWATSSEENNEWFIVERSGDGINFSELSRQPGSGTTGVTHQYTDLDTNPFDGWNYYRLAQKDYNGNETRSHIVAINNDRIRPRTLPASDLKVYPNPTMGDMLTISSHNLAMGKVNMELITTTGISIINTTFNSNGEGALLQTIDVSTITSGLYTLKLTDTQGKAYLTRVSISY